MPKRLNLSRFIFAKVSVWVVIGQIYSNWEFILNIYIYCRNVSIIRFLGCYCNCLDKLLDDSTLSLKINASFYLLFKPLKSLVNGVYTIVTGKLLIHDSLGIRNFSR